MAPSTLPMNWPVAYPEIVLLACTCVVALVDLFVNDERRRLTYWLAQLSMAVVAVMHLAFLNAGLTEYGMQQIAVADPMSHLLALFATIAVMITIAYALPYIGSRELRKGEFFSLSMMVLLGISVMVSANNFLAIYLGLEIMSLSLYALVALRRDDKPATEAAMKYFVLGALASGFLLYGLSMMYGATGSLSIPEVFNVIATGRVNGQVLTFGVVFIVAGIGFKFGAAPFHMWAPDVYQGAPTPITLLIAGASKMAAFGVTIRLLVEGMLGLAIDWQQMLVVLSVMSLALGNIAAIAQTNFKRMLAYSAIAHMGFTLLGLTAGVVGGNTISAGNAYSSSLFYLVAYVLTTLAAFGLVMLIARDGFEADEIRDLAGLSKRSPWMAGVMAIVMFSFAGIPPTIGFYAKLAVLQALVTTNVTGYIWLAVIAVMLSLIGAFYYIRVVKVMYFDEPTDPHPVSQASGVNALLAANGLAVLVLGLLPGGLMALCADAVVRALAS